MQRIDTPSGTFNQTAPTIDVRLVNSGTGTALIVGCDVEVAWAHRFTHVLPPKAENLNGGAALLPPTAHYVVLLPSPEKADGRVFKGDKAKPNPLELALRERDGLNLSYEIKPGDTDRFLVRLEVEPHGGGTLFDHAMPGDDRIAYQVRLLIRYIGGRKTQTLATEKVGIVSPANTLPLPTEGEIRELIDRFRAEVRTIDDEINKEMAAAGVKPWNWPQLKSTDKSIDLALRGRKKRDIDALREALDRRESLSCGFYHPDYEVGEFLSDLERLCQSVIEETPPRSDLSEAFVPAAQQALAEIRAIRSEQFN